MRWTEATLGEITSDDRGLIQTGPFGSQLHQSDYTDQGTPVIMPTDISDGRVMTDRIARVSDQTADRLSRHELKPRTIVLPRRGEITKRAFIREGEEGWLCGSGCLKIEVHGTDLVPEFLYYYMAQHEVVQWLEQHAVGSTMLNLSAGIVNEMPVRYPPQQEQEKIAGMLFAYDDLLENNRRRIWLLEDAARLLYCEWFIRLRFPGHEHTRITNGIPTGWQVLPLRDVCPDLREAASPADLEADTPYIGLEHMPRRSITLNEWGRAEEVTSTKLRYRAGDILFGKIRPYFHKVGIALTDGVTSSDAIVLRPSADIFHSFALLTVSCDWFVTVVSKTAKEGSKMPRADWKLMEQQAVVVPSSGILAALNETVAPILEQLRTLSFANQKLRAARDLLLPRLMSGEIAV
jgi:type I restriction enzyme S subunit